MAVNRSDAAIGAGYPLGFHKPETDGFRTPKGLNRNVVEMISEFKNEPKWMRQYRL
jgi:Fe-S cluster assembly protein SufB